MGLGFGFGVIGFRVCLECLRLDVVSPSVCVEARSRNGNHPSLDSPFLVRPHVIHVLIELLPRKGSEVQSCFFNSVRDSGIEDKRARNSISFFGELESVVRLEFVDFSIDLFQFENQISCFLREPR